MPAQNYNYERAARVILLVRYSAAKDPMSDAARQAGVSRQTVYRDMKRHATDTRLQQLVSEKEAEFKARASTWVPEAVSFLLKALRKLGELVEQAKPEPGSIREVAGAVKIVGELETVREVLKNGEQPGADPEGSSAKEATAGAVH